jgi:hypothetical protein
MSLDPHELDTLSRSDLVARAQKLGAERPDVMTRVELRDEIIRLSEADPAARRRSRGFLGVARDLVASVVGAGLNMKDAAAVIRGEAQRDPEFQGPPPVATLTLAEIYAAQGHWDRALQTLSEVLEREPDHPAALSLRERLTQERDEGGARRRPPAAPQLERELEPGVVAEAFSSEPEPEPEPLPPIASPDSDDALGEAPAAPPVHEPVPQTPRVAAAPIVIGVSHDADDELSLGGAFTVRSHAQLRAPYRGTADCVLLVRDDSIELRFDLPVLPPSTVVRLVGFSPGADGPAKTLSDTPVLARQGSLSLPGFGRGVVVRAALGTLGSSGFEPFVVARVYRATGGSKVLEFSPPGAVPGTLDRAS